MNRSMREFARQQLIGWLCSSTFAAGVANAQVPWTEEPDLAKVALPILDTARQQPEALWAFLIDPETPYTNAVAAATRGGDVFPLRLVEQLLRARVKLRREEQVHGFGLERPNLAWTFPAPEPGFARERHLLGRTWTVPEQRLPYPTTWVEAQAAPWPWRAQQVLDRAWTAVVKWIGVPYSYDCPANRAWKERSRAWYAECLRWRIDDDESAQIFFEATSVPAHGKSLPVLARWRRILLDPNTPIAAAQVGNALGDAHRLLLHGEPDARLACQIIAGDGLRLSPHLQALYGCAYQLRWFTTVYDAKMGEAHVPCPPEALLAAGDLAAAAPPPDEPGRWNQLVFVVSVCEAVDRPPFADVHSVPPEQRDVAALLAKFSTWWATFRPAVEAQVAARAENVERLRKQLEEMAR